MCTVHLHVCNISILNALAFSYINSFRSRTMQAFQDQAFVSLEDNSDLQYNDTCTCIALLYCVVS